MQRGYQANMRRNSQVADASVGLKDDLFSEMLSKLAERRFLVFVSILVFLLFLSVACDQVLAGAEPAVQTPSAIQHDSNSTYLDAGVEASNTPRTGTEDPSAFSLLFAEGLEPDAGNASWLEGMATLAFRLTLAAVLGALVAFRPRRPSMRHRNPHVVQSQILLTVVACALMMIIGDSAARAFGIFAAAALVRFRTNIRDPKEITILLINLGVGLAAGVGRWELASIFTLFVLLLLQLLESYEHHQVGSLMELKLRTHDVDATDGAVRELLRRNNLDPDIRRLNKQNDKHPLGKVVYSVDIGSKLNTDRLGEEIYLADPINIAGVEWRRKKTRSLACRG